MDLNTESSKFQFLNSSSRMMYIAEEILPALKGHNNFNLTIEALDNNSMSNIRKILLNAVSWIFEGAQKMFFSAKKIFYIGSMLLMIYDAYR